MSTSKWEVGQTVDVQSRTWAGINKPGGCAKITQVHFARDGVQVESIDVKYVLGGGFEREIDPAIVSPFEMLERGGRKRRGREFLMEQADTVVKKVKNAMATTKQAGATKKGSKQQPANKKKKKKTILNRITTPARHPDQSTSPSTPVTPEHPTASKPKTALKASSGKTETGVPAYVYTNASSVETSPLEDHVNWAFTDTKKTTIARRGLFGTSKKKGASIPLAKENTKDNYADQSGSSSLVRSREESSRSMNNSPNAPAAQNVLHLKGTIPYADSVGVSSVDDNHKTAQDVRKAHSAAVKQSLSKKNKPFVAKKAPLSDRKPTAKETSATTKKTASLKNVFDNELRKARQFLDQMCQAPAQEIQDDPVNPHAEESRLDTSGSEKEGDDDVKKPAAVNHDSRRQEFLDLFRSFRRIFDDEDGTMEESAFRTLISQKAVKPFSAKELDDNLQHLYQQGKLMQSEGVLYMID